MLKGVKMCWQQHELISGTRRRIMFILLSWRQGTTNEVERRGWPGSPTFCWHPTEFTASHHSCQSSNTNGCALTILARALDKLHALLQQAEEKISTFMWSIRSKDNSLYPGYSYYFMLKDIRNMFINCHIWNSLIVMTHMLLCPSWSKFQRQILEKKNFVHKKWCLEAYLLHTYHDLLSSMRIKPMAAFWEIDYWYKTTSCPK